MKKHFLLFTLTLSSLLFVSSCSYYDWEDINRPTEKSNLPEEVVITEKNLFPEGLAYDQFFDRYLVTSFTRGNIGQVTDGGNYQVFVDDDTLVSTVALYLDALRKRVLVTVSDIGQSEKSSPETIRQLAALAAYDLVSGKRIFYTRLDPLVAGEHFANEVTIDPEGNAYVTDSFVGVIYRVDTAGNASVYYQDEDLAPAPGEYGLNGVAYDPRGYLLVAKTDENKLFRFPIDNPSAYNEVRLPVTPMDPDGITLKRLNEMVLVANDFGGPEGAVFTFKTHDAWESVALVDTFKTGAVFPTNPTLRRGVPYVIYAHLDELLAEVDRTTFRIVKVE